MNETTVVRKVVVVNPHGLHARPADLFARRANQFLSRVAVWKGNEEADGKSILDILTLAVTAGTELSIVATGSDAEAAAEALAELASQNFELMGDAD
ncbi:MAG: HPr family phosphocarrier protein [Planctomycetales bacterium]|nr:HPr family phosphocarrier protein [Planctomycetales bacterium]